MKFKSHYWLDDANRSQLADELRRCDKALERTRSAAARVNRIAESRSWWNVIGWITARIVGHRVYCEHQRIISYIDLLRLYAASLPVTPPPFDGMRGTDPDWLP